MQKSTFRAYFAIFPVKFPVSREFPQRLDSSRLHGLPISYSRNECCGVGPGWFQLSSVSSVGPVSVPVASGSTGASLSV